MTSRALTVAHEPPGNEWELVDSMHGDVVARGSLVQVRLARVQYEDATWASGHVPASTYVRPARRLRFPAVS